MSNLVQDQRVINHLERPKSEDFNLAQSLTAQTQQLLTSALYTGGAAWQPSSSVPTFYPVVDGPRSLKITQGNTVDEVVWLLPGMMLQLGSASTDVDGIMGVSQFSTKQLVSCSSTRILTLPAAPTSAGSGMTMRRDLIAVREFAALAEYEPTDIFTVGTRSFGAPVDKPKMFRRDLADAGVAPLQVLNYNNTSGATSSIICITGEEITQPLASYDILTAPVPSVPSGYSALAVVNRYQGAGISTNDIVDTRILAPPGGNRHSLFMRAIIGTAGLDTRGSVGSFSIVSGGYNQPYFALLRGDSADDTRQTFSIDIFTQAQSSGELSATVVQGPISDDNTTPLLFPIESFDPQNTVTETYFSALTSSRYPYDVDLLRDNIAIGQNYMNVRFSMAGLVVPTGSDLPKLDKTLNSFGENPSGGTYARVPVYIRIDWTPFVASYV